MMVTGLGIATETRETMKKDKYTRRSRNIGDDEENSFKKDTAHSVSKSQKNAPSRVSKSSTSNAYYTYSSVASQSSSAPANNTEDDFDDFDPRGTFAKVLKW
ncbi:uncharacterized protein LOC107489623 isoform X1 [Arachis duranensis]|uniref:Uncharacterized protein LOC107489623 isoform X1 n=1 Tax=Arachis duranensis TaxID=130453 RepID=A0A6P4DC73_ARADU|nr:uncharacterized protein LOC107489623 isoform X1 [Arachis duranensis]XP_025700378.1 uncharacterized protein LOC112801690 isoform X1 [Arachis hypogaea]QHO42370.1 uncharacterized protein DS421_5g153580 [Arachis hypogaea]